MDIFHGFVNGGKIKANYEYKKHASVPKEPYWVHLSCLGLKAFRSTTAAAGLGMIKGIGQILQ